VIGYGAGRRFALGNVTLKPGDSRQDGFSAVTVTVVDGELAGTAPCRLLVTASGYFQNTDWGLEQIDDERVTLRRRWGRAPTLVEVVPARITLPLPAGDVRAWALDERGQRSGELAVQADEEGRAVVAVGPPHGTLWYEVSAR
jgi:hypothetical protein